MNYQSFLESKRIMTASSGITVSPEDINPILYPFQRDITRWALRKGRAASFEDCGLGKTFQQLEWARLTGERALIIAPLSVAKQTVREGRKLNIDVHYARSSSDLSQINITNYEMAEHFDPDLFGAVVLDESSILKGLDGATRKRLTDMFAETPYRLCCTATPAPNDITEIANHAEFLGIMSRENMLAMFFVHDDQGWRLKKHATDAFYRWLASWAVAIRFPSDLGYSDDGFILPDLEILPHYVDVDYCPKGQLFWDGQLKGIQDRTHVRKETMKQRLEATTELVKGNDQWICWCGLNDEAAKLQAMIPDSVNVEGSMPTEAKQAALEGFQDEKIRVLITKVKIAGMGMNFQNAHKMAFVGLGDSYEQYYQAIRREYRFGQKYPVKAHIMISNVEKAIYDNVLRKEQEAGALSKHLIENIREFEKAEVGAVVQSENYSARVAMRLPRWLRSERIA